MTFQFDPINMLEHYQNIGVSGNDTCARLARIRDDNNESMQDASLNETCALTACTCQNPTFCRVLQSNSQ
jgi:hypothetical protein